MKKLELEFIGLNDKELNILVDGKFVKPKKNKDKIYTACYSTDKDECEVVVFKPHRYLGKGYLWWNLLFFFISIFGIFDVRANKRLAVLDCRFTIKLESDTLVRLARLDFVDGEKAIEIITQAQTCEIANVHYFDKDAKIRSKKVKRAKIISTALAVLIAVALIIIL